jgi:hypothetical protein
MFTRLYIADDANVRKLDISRPSRAGTPIGSQGNISTITGGASSYSVNELFFACSTNGSSADCNESPIVSGSTGLSGVVSMTYVGRTGALIVAQVGCASQSNVGSALYHYSHFPPLMRVLTVFVKRATASEPVPCDSHAPRAAVITSGTLR